MKNRLKSLTIENFRSLRGKLLVPLDAQVVLIHGSNGMGKTSVLSALELALTGAISHLEEDEKAPRQRKSANYKQFITTIGTSSGRIELTTENADFGTLEFSDEIFQPNPLLGEEAANFFAQRCYLPQATLGKLLEIYDDQKPSANSQLTVFVKELLKLEPLDALVEGLDHANHVTRVRKITPEYRELEELQKNYVAQNERASSGLNLAVTALDERLARINLLLASLNTDHAAVNRGFDAAALTQSLPDQGEENLALAEVADLRSELSRIKSRWAQTNLGGPVADIADKERGEAAVAADLALWQYVSGVRILGLLSNLSAFHVDLTTMDEDPQQALDEAQVWSNSDLERCKRLLAEHTAGSEQVRTLKTTIQRAEARISELNVTLTAGARDARALATALAGVAPHVEGDICPVCSRDFAETETGSLTAHIAATIASLTGQAGRLQTLSNERAEETTRLNSAQRDLAAAERRVLSSEDAAELLRREAVMASFQQSYASLRDEAAKGTALMQSLARHRQDLASTRRAEESSSTLLPDMDALLARIGVNPARSYESIDAALVAADQIVLERLATFEKERSVRLGLLSELDAYERETLIVKDRAAESNGLTAKIQTIKKAIEQVDGVRSVAKKIGDAAASVRSDIVRQVFSSSLNKVWRDLFVRLAPSEQFVPTFKLPSDDRGGVEATLETLHRSGATSGPPGAMLSQGNLNTAALTLFLALHLSVPNKFPWLVLDDPVQSMDDVHIAQFAALLRTLSKGMDRQIILAVHERALFDYLTLELSPAFSGDTLLAVEILKDIDGNSYADPRYLTFEDDNAVAA